MGSHVGCYSGVGVVQSTFNTSSAVIGGDGASWGLAMYPGTHSPTTATRIQAALRLAPGNKVKLDLNMAAGTLQIFVNSALTCNYSGLASYTLTPAITLCCCDSGHTLTCLDQ